jgi:hypothetical protein
MKLIASLFLATTILAHAEVKVAVGDISDRRTSGRSGFNGLEVELKVSGPELTDCKGMRVVVKEAKDDAGKAIKVQESGFNDGGFEPLQKAFGGGFGDQKQNEFGAKVQLENPARSAKTLTLDAAVELLVPSKDPASIVSANVAKEAGKPLAGEALKAAGATITLNAAKGDEIGYTISDPNKKVASVEFCSADGKPLESNGRFSSGFGGKKDVTINLSNKAPADAMVKIYLLTAKSVVSVPVKLSAVALP